MQRSLKLTRFKCDRLLAHCKSDLTRGLTAVVVFLPQALAFAAASGVEPKAEFYTAVVAGTVAAALVFSPILQGSCLGKNLKGGRGVTSAK